jgi:catechol 2,3-dioxygenase-like lactoylglutathione lyase family enzyme
MDVLSAAMAFDHLAYLVRDTAQSVEALRPFFPEVKLLRKSHELQGAYITYMSTDDGRITIELVEPFEDNKLLADRLDREKQRCLPYHICFRVDDFEAEYKRMREHGWLTLTRPFAGLSSATQAAHLYKPAAGIVEIVGRR